MFQDLDDMLPRKAQACKLAKFIDTLEQNDQEILKAALANQQKWSTNGLHTALRQKGVNIGYQVIYRHRSNTCSCEKQNA